MPHRSAVSAVRAAFGLALLLLALPPAAAAQGVLHVLNWTDYIDPYAVQRFQQETGIRVRYDVFDSLEALEGRLSAGRSGYDVVVPTAEPTLARLIRAGALQPLDRARLPHWAGLDAALLRRVAGADPENRHAAVYLWGTVGLAANTARLRALAPDIEPSLALLLDPAQAARVARCGLAVMDSATDVLPTVLRHLGRDPNGPDLEDLRAAERALLAIRPHLRAIPGSGQLVDMLATGEICAALTYSGDAIQAAVRARAAGRNVEVTYLPPTAGAHLWFDVLAIPADAPNPDAAHRFIDFLLRPDVMAGITGQVRYPNAVPASRPLLPAAVRDDPNVYPAEAALAAAYVVGTPNAAAERARARLWARFKAGR